MYRAIAFLVRACVCACLIGCALFSILVCEISLLFASGYQQMLFGTVKQLHSVLLGQAFGYYFRVPASGISKKNLQNRSLDLLVSYGSTGNFAVCLAITIDTKMVPKRIPL